MTYKSQYSLDHRCALTLEQLRRTHKRLRASGWFDTPEAYAAGATRKGASIAEENEMRCTPFEDREEFKYFMREHAGTYADGADIYLRVRRDEYLQRRNGQARLVRAADVFVIAIFRKT